MAEPQDPRDVPSRWRQVFVTPFTPTWALGLLVGVCLFLPSYRGCNGEVIYA